MDSAKLRVKALAVAGGASLVSLVVLLQLLAVAIVAAPNGLGVPTTSRDYEGASLRVQTRDGVELEASVLEPSPSSGAVHGCILLLHGVRMDRSAVWQRAQGFVRAGYRAILVDLPGHGRSDGRFLTYGVLEARDLSVLLDELERRGLLGKKVGVYGFSYGGAVAIQLAARDPRVRAVVAVSSFSSLERVVSDYLRRYLPVVGSHVPEFAVRTAVAEAGAIAHFEPSDADAARTASRLTVPLLLMHGDRDSQVPPYHSERLKRAAGPLARLVLLPGETHSSVHVDAAGAVGRRSVLWFDRWLG